MEKELDNIDKKHHPNLTGKNARTPVKDIAKRSLFIFPGGFCPD